MHHLLGLGCKHSETISDVWDSLSGRNLILKKYNLRVIELLDFYKWSVMLLMSFTYFSKNLICFFVNDIENTNFTSKRFSLH